MREQIIIELTPIVRQILKMPELELTENTGPENIPDWDSINNILIMGTVEKHFRIKFDTKEIMAMENLSDLISGIELKLQLKKSEQ